MGEKSSRTRLNLIVNKDGQKSMMIVDVPMMKDVINTRIMEHCKNKLKVKNISRICLLNGETFNGEEHVQNDVTLLIFQQDEEASVGKMINPSISKEVLKKDPIMSANNCCFRCNVKFIGEEFANSDVINDVERISRMDGVVSILALPDLSAAVPCPVGTSITVENRIYPGWIGTDIGCGISLFRILNCKSKRFEKLHQKLVKEFRDKWHREDARMFREKQFPNRFEGEIDLYVHDENLGSIGAGNHFCELQESNNGEIYLCVHSGSRSLGTDIHGRFGREQTLLKTEDIGQFLKHQQIGIAWAKLNRLAIAKRFINYLKFREDRFDSLEDEDLELIIDLCHNFIEEETKIPSSENVIASLRYIHRKGAIPTNQGPAMIPGSRGTHSYLVVANSNPDNAINSLPHGAGRKYTKTDAEFKFSKPDTTHALTQGMNDLIICNDKKLFAQEAPGAYKDIDEIMENLVRNGYIEILGIFTPILTLKYNGL